jgi:hypothetical protein
VNIQKRKSFNEDQSFAETSRQKIGRNNNRDGREGISGLESSNLFDDGILEVGMEGAGDDSKHKA